MPATQRTAHSRRRRTRSVEPRQRSARNETWPSEAWAHGCRRLDDWSNLRFWNSGAAVADSPLLATWAKWSGVHGWCTMKEGRSGLEIDRFAELSCSARAAGSMEAPWRRAGVGGRTWSSHIAQTGTVSIVAAIERSRALASSPSKDPTPDCEASAPPPPKMSRTPRAWTTTSRRAPALCWPAAGRRRWRADSWIASAMGEREGLARAAWH